MASSLSFASDYGTARISEVRTIYDGDTFKVNINKWPSIIGEGISVRVKGIDTPEMRGDCQAEKDAAKLAKQHTVSMLREGTVIELRSVDRDKYFRLLAEVWIDNVSLGESLIKANLAVPYEGGKKTNWCG